MAKWLALLAEVGFRTLKRLVRPQAANTKKMFWATHLDRIRLIVSPFLLFSSHFHMAKQWNFNEEPEKRIQFLIQLSSEFLASPLALLSISWLNPNRDRHPKTRPTSFFLLVSPSSLFLTMCFLFIISWLGASSSSENSYLLNIREKNSRESIFCAWTDKHKTQSGRGGGEQREGREERRGEERRGPHPVRDG